MSSSNKILTVSYGTFSCTLEGFEDSFGAMKEIAEYFRGLAAEDRYFGSEPPPLDPDTIQNIAQRRSRHSVKARQSGNEIHLRASAQPFAGASPAPATEPTTSASPGSQQVDDKLSRIRAAVDAQYSPSQDDAGDDLTDVNYFDTDIEMREHVTDENLPEVLSERSTSDGLPATDMPRAEQEEAHDALVLETPVVEVETDESFGQQDDPPELTADPLPEDDTDFEARANARLLALRRELEQSAAKSKPEESTPAAAPEPVQTDPPKSERLLSARAQENSVARLMDEANSKLEGPENKRRHISIAHLKAAVAATKAERRSTSQDLSKTRERRQQDPYRQDLAKAVGEPAVTKKATDETGHGTQGKKRVPLMLVSEQRVPADERTPRPKRSTPRSESSFAEYAERVGATDLPELLEAAVAYAMLGSQDNVVTRPQIMATLAQLFGDDEFSREESLRAFGTLLREGRIRKLRHGQFAISENSPFIDTKIPGE